MKYVKSNSNYTYHIDFKVDGEFVSPSAATITVTKNDGTVVGSILNSSLTVNGTGADFVINSSNNALTLDKEFRYIEVNFTYSGKSYQTIDFYELRTSLILPVSKADVRNLLSLDQSELSDEQIDLFKAYDGVKGDTQTDIDSILTTGSSLIKYVIDAIVCKASIDSLLFIENVLLQSEQADNTVYKKFMNIDFTDMLNRLNNKYQKALLLVEGTATGAGLSLNSFLAVNPTDPVTGA